jgi:hypothetical protein
MTRPLIYEDVGAFAGIFGSPFAVLNMPRDSARVIKFPAKAGKKRDGCYGM